jgi:hypothetical protein
VRPDSGVLDGPCKRCTEKSIECVRESPCVQSLRAKRQPARSTGSSQSAPVESSHSAPCKSRPPGTSGRALHNRVPLAWYKHPVFNALGPAFDLLTGGLGHVRGVEQATACQFWRSEVARTGAAAAAAAELHKWTLMMCVEAFTRAFTEPAGEPRVHFEEVVLEGKGKGRADAMDEDDILEDEDADDDSGSGDWDGF